MQEERFQQIIDYIRENRAATFTELSELTGVSIDTLRRDLVLLEQKQLLKRVRGGATLINDERQLQSFLRRSISHQSEKAALATLVGKVVREGQTIALNHGTTNVSVARYLCTHFDHLIILTTSFSVLNVLCEKPKFSVIVPGGAADLGEGCLYGGHCEREIKHYNIDVALIAANAVSLSKGVTDFRINEVGVIQAMIESSSYKYIVADSSKFETMSCMNVCELSAVDAFLTDSALKIELREKYKLSGVNVLVSEL